MDKMYIDKVSSRNNEQIITAIILPEELAKKKSELNSLIEKKSAELPDPDKSNLEQYAKLYDETITPLRKEKNEIKGYTRIYVIKNSKLLGQNFKVGEIIDALPANAIPLEDSINEYEEDFSDIE